MWACQWSLLAASVTEHFFVLVKYMYPQKCLLAQWLANLKLNKYCRSPVQSSGLVLLRSSTAVFRCTVSTGCSLLALNLVIKIIIVQQALGKLSIGFPRHDIYKGVSIANSQLLYTLYMVHCICSKAGICWIFELLYPFCLLGAVTPVKNQVSIYLSVHHSL